ncbi:MAG: radical SAM family heme chaperone HemW [Bacteroidales bacterium]|nr:radical SAM family heme chaperone HemW [Bacteroidales bacterium]
MAGIYIHIPFCKSKCAYCGFYSLPSMKLKECFLEALKAEIVARKDYFKQRSHCGLDPQPPSLMGKHLNPPINTIYFGGGTPSLLSIKEIGELLQLIKETYPVAEKAEITLEANPDTLSLDYLKGLRLLGVNRLSIGIQSFFDNDLKYLSRRHDSQHARQCIDWAKQAGFSNISIDLIYGLPTSNAEQWNRNLDLFFELNLPHLSAYALTLEPNAILTKLIEQGKVPPVNEEDALRDYEILCKRAVENGYLHYEISNFCRSGLHSKHNASYWFGTPYVGFGPSAHSFDGNSRQWNVSSVDRYCVRIPELSYEKESLSVEQHYDEYVMLRLRTHWGIDLKWLKREMGERFSTYCEQHAQPLIDQGRLSQTREFLYLTDQQMLFADGVAEELFWE